MTVIGPVGELVAAGFTFSVTCWFLDVSSSAYYETLTRPPSPRARANRGLTKRSSQPHGTVVRTDRGPHLLEIVENGGSSTLSVVSW